MPGVVSADKIVVQSEQMRKVYIKKLTEFAGEDTAAVWEEKILGLGAPGFDKEKEKRNAVKLPKEWESVFYKGDGGQKKVILYNTVPEAMLEHKEAMLDKIRNTLAVFEGQKEEIALVWCANLSKSDYVKEIQPKLWKKYRQLVKEYSDAGWGIYCDLLKDEEKEAILKFGHGYYGDPEPIVNLCRRSNMTALIQNVRVLYDRQMGEEKILSNDSTEKTSDKDAYKALNEQVVRESTEKTLIQMEQYLMQREETLEEEMPSKTYGEIIFEALK